MNDLEKSRQFWKRIICAIEIIMVVGSIPIIAYAVKLPFVGAVIGFIIVYAPIGAIIYVGNYLNAELDRQLPPPERIFLED